MNNFCLIFAHDDKYGIGKSNSLPWPFNKDDMRQFKEKTIGNGNNCVIMGNNTFKSMNSKPLPKRMNYVITSKADELNKEYKLNNLLFVSNYYNLFIEINKNNFEKMWIIGGTSIYEYFIKKMFENIKEIHVTKISGDYSCDVFFGKSFFESEYFINNFKIYENYTLNNTEYTIYKC
jgi:dihydrofolate reductase